ncbi:anti-sigma factor [Pedobacter sp. KBW01]|uniref:FecR family protein n=1 Tax=Pedobacter sp. KBW01 TaxID=2153364 RepID=UPI000F5AB128|nr:FecR family protein [Pedobacter sp. KBW01]RQO77782.1 anti-sigma factor [Pedobacter sp. KBW01]
MDKQTLDSLTQKINLGAATDQEIGLFNAYMNLLAIGNQDWAHMNAGGEESVKMALWSMVYKGMDSKPKTVKLFPWRKVAAVAAMFAVIITATIILFLGTQHENRLVVVNDVSPGREGAILTLSNGKKIRLSDAVNGEISKETGVTVTKTEDGQLVYTIGDSNIPSTNAMNTLTTGMGETYRVALPDGTKVWLNAASSLSYSASLLDKGKRKVKLSGEGYFEVAKDKQHPFIVSTDREEVEVLGTHFNIESYRDNDKMTTTLLEGSVRVTGARDMEVLKPGFEAVDHGGTIKLNKVNAEDAIDWKNGMFIFQDEELQSIMKRVSRWYNVEIIYDKGVDRSERFGGGVSRYDKVSKVLETLQFTGDLKFKVEGRRITIMK